MMPIEANPKELAELEGIKAFKPETIEALKNKSMKEIRDIIVAEFGIKTTDEIKTYQKQAEKTGERLTLLQAELRLSHMLESKQKMLTIETTLNALMERNDNKGQIIPKASEFADAFMRHGSYYQIKGDPHLYHKVGNIYKPDGKECVQELIERFYPDATAGFVSEVVRKLEHRNPIDRDKFDADPNILVCPNTLLAIDGETPKTYPALQEIATEYRPELGISVLFLKLLDEIMPDPEARAGLLECCSTILLKGSIKFVKYIVFRGDGANGKSLLLKVLERLLGKGACSHISWQKLESRFGPSGLEGKYANLFAELPTAALTKTETIKGLVDQETIAVEKKGIDLYEIVFTGRIFFACNTLPEIPSYQKADLRRIFLFTFSQVFEGENCKEDLLDTLTTPTERSKILNTLLAEARKVRKNGLQYKQSEREISRLWSMNSSSSLEYINQYTHGEGKIKTSELYSQYVSWCKENKRCIDGPKTFTSRMEGDGFSKIRTTVNGEKNTFWTHIKAKSDKKSDKQTSLSG